MDELSVVFDRPQLKSKHYISKASSGRKEAKYKDFRPNPKEFIFLNEFSVFLENGSVFRRVSIM